jgi:hypothetical protein
MNKARRFHPDRKRRGQAFVEFGIMLGLMVFLASAAFEVSRYVSMSVRIASTCREAGRLFVSLEIEPDANKTKAQNQTDLYSSINTNVYGLTDTDGIRAMVYPSDINAQGKVIVSIIIRQDPNNDTVYTTPSTYDDDYIQVEYQFVFPSRASTGTRAAWISKVGAADRKIDSNHDGFATLPGGLALDSLRVGERTVFVEIYHTVETIFPASALKSADLDYIYDKAVF